MNDIADKIVKQQQMYSTIQKLKAEEAALRREIATELLQGKASGTHKFTYGDMVVKVVRSIDYSIDQKIIKQKIADGELSDEEFNALNVKYELSLTRYKQLELSPSLDEVITTKDAMPSISVSYPGEK